MVSGGEDDLEGGEGLVRGVDEVEEGALGLGTGVDGVEDVTGNEECVGAVFREKGEEVGKEGSVFVFAVEAVEGLAEVPVSGVEDTHGFWEGAAG